MEDVILGQLRPLNGRLSSYPDSEQWLFGVCCSGSDAFWQIRDMGTVVVGALLDDHCVAHASILLGVRHMR
jgi:hypothetical protein